VSYRDRTHAGAVLAEALATALPADAGRDDVVVLGLPRGGVPVAARVAAALNAPLDVMVVRKLGVPGHEELAFGALASGGVRVLNHEVVAAGRVSPEEMARVTERASGELASAERRLRGDRPPP
jgi:predicted phosphoribosyltransferase